ncbi:MAG: hypothetical protein IJI66_10425 [Erysipelotrichaceae bacterium]|nr:hypothetical protein [Erysipelotrichaceae bacterium]
MKENRSFRDIIIKHVEGCKDNHVHVLAVKTEYDYDEYGEIMDEEYELVHIGNIDTRIEDIDVASSLAKLILFTSDSYGYENPADLLEEIADEFLLMDCDMECENCEHYNEYHKETQA